MVSQAGSYVCGNTLFCNLSEAFLVGTHDQVCNTTSSISVIDLARVRFQGSTCPGSQRNWDNDPARGKSTPQKGLKATNLTEKGKKFFCAL